MPPPSSVQLLSQLYQQLGSLRWEDDRAPACSPLSLTISVAEPLSPSDDSPGVHAACCLDLTVNAIQEEGLAIPAWQATLRCAPPAGAHCAPTPHPTHQDTRTQYSRRLQP
jgi:hypothetical protein